MANRSRVALAKEKIQQAFSRLKKHVFQYDDLATLFRKNKGRWNLPSGMNLTKFIEALEKESIINYGEFTFVSDEYLFYYLTDTPVYSIVSHTIPDAYISHQSALALQKLIPHSYNKIYINKEQTKAPSKSVKGTLSQSAIDKAFAKEQRTSGSRIEWRDFEIVLLKGMSSDKLGVVDFMIDKNDYIQVTDVERTLIDCVVRSAYGGGSVLILEAFFTAKSQNKISAARLKTYLDELDYVYPYDQAVGFYMSMAGNYTNLEMDLFKDKVTKFDFYLEYDLKTPDYSIEWRIFYPKGMKKY